MSGRTRHTLADGRRVTGFRKTLARRTRVPAYLLPDWQLIVPEKVHGMMLLPPGPTSVSGVSIGYAGEIVARGKNKVWLRTQVCAYLAKHGISITLPYLRRVT